MTHTAALLAALALLGAPLASHAETPEPTPAHHREQELFTCGMHPQVIRDRPGTCPICSMELTPLPPQPPAVGAQRERRILYYWDPMLSPPYISDKPGKSPMGMDLIPVYEDEVSAGGGIVIDPAIVQNMGVRLGTVGAGPLRRRLRAVGYVKEPEPARRDVNLRVSGWIQRLYADVEGMHVQAGAPLFELYSPDLQVAIGELIAARKSLPKDAAHGETAALLYATTREKLALLGLPRAYVERLAQLERAPQTVTFTSPITGHLIEKLVAAGDAVRAGDTVLRLSDRSTMWIDARIFERDLPMAAVGRKAVATLPALPGQVIAGTIDFVHPHLDPATRTGLARMVISNPGMQLRQDMYATVEIEAELAARAVLAPREAVIDTGTEQVAFVARPGGHFDPRKVTVGASGEGDVVEILAGLAPGEQVVTSGQFLLDAESNFRTAIQRFLGAREAAGQQAAPEGQPSGHMPGGHAH